MPNFHRLSQRREIREFSPLGKIRQNWGSFRRQIVLLGQNNDTEENQACWSNTFSSPFVSGQQRLLPI